MRILLTSFALAGLAALGASQTNVALGKSVIDSSSFYDAGSETFPVANLVDGKIDDSGSPSNWSFWLTAQGQNTGYATIDLGAVYSLSSFELQDTHNRGYFDRGTKDYHILLSADGVNYSTAVTDTFSEDEWRNLTWKTDTLGTPVAARYVKVSIDSGWGGQSVGLNELRAMGQPVPEPATMAALGLGAVGFLRRRKR